MIGIITASVRQYAGRLVATALAIILAVAFVTTGLVVTTTLDTATRHAVTADLDQAELKVEPNPHSALSDDEEGKAFQALAETVGAIDGVQAAFVNADAPVALRAGEERTTLSLSVVAPESIRWYELAVGEWPTGPDQVVVPASLTERLKVNIGDRVDLSPLYEESATAHPVTIVGIVHPHGLANPFENEYVLADSTAGSGLSHELFVNGLLVKAEPGTPIPELQRVLTEQIDPAIGQVLTRDEVAANAAESLTGSTVLGQAVILAFGLLTFVVAGFVIANTFQLVITQRTRSFALLRCVGATRAQVRRMILGEAGVVGLVFSTVGALTGIALAYGLNALAQLGEGDFAFGQIVVDPLIIVGCIALGMITTMVFSYGAARRATVINPVEALRPQTAFASERGSWVVAVVGGLIAMVGTGAMIYLAPQNELILAILAGAVSALGVLVLVRLFLPYLIWGVGQLIAPLGSTTRLAVVNSLRNKARTSATGSALLIGTVIVVLLATGIHSVRESVIQTIDAHRPIDLVVSSGEPLTADALAALTADPDVLASAPFFDIDAELAKGSGPYAPVWLHAIDPVPYRQVTHSPVPVPRDGFLLVRPKNEEQLQDGERVTLKGSAGTLDLTVVTDANHRARTYDITTADMRTLVGEQPIYQLFLKITPGLRSTEVQKVVTRLTASVDGVDVFGDALERATYNEILDTISLVLIALLGVAVVIAVVGVGNTAALSVYERRQESAMLRAIGCTRAQLRTMITTEAVLGAVVTVCLGVVLGVAYAWAGVVALGSSATELGMRLVIPVDQLAVIMVGALVAGLLASALPAYGAAKRPIVADLASV